MTVFRDGEQPHSFHIVHEFRGVTGYISDIHRDDGVVFIRLHDSNRITGQRPQRGPKDEIYARIEDLTKAGYPEIRIGQRVILNAALVKFPGDEIKARATQIIKYNVGLIAKLARVICSATPPIHEDNCTVKWFNKEKGYGFLLLPGPEKREVFIHVTTLHKTGLETLTEGQSVWAKYEPNPDKKGELVARRVGLNEGARTTAALASRQGPDRHTKGAN